MQVVSKDGKHKVVITREEWVAIGSGQKWLKTAKWIDVEYGVGWESGTKKKRMRIDPGESRDDIQRRLEKAEKDTITIEKYVPVAEIRTKKGPSLKDQQRMRGEKQRKERSKRQLLQEKQQFLKGMGVDPATIKNLDAPSLDSMIEFFKNQQKAVEDLDTQTEEVDFLDLMRSKKVSNRKVKIRLSRSKWEDIGKKQGWTKKRLFAAENKK